MPDVYLHLSEKIPSTFIQPRSPITLTLLYFIPGNPGLIEYYIPFLTLLTKQSEKWTNKGKSFAIAGASLGGFEASTSTPILSNQSNGSTSPPSNVKEADKDLLPLYPPSFSRKQSTTYTLRDQIELTHARLTTLVSRLQSQHQSQNPNPDTAAPLTIKVILSGHSVGAYIALEVINLHHNQHHTTQSSPPPSPNTPHYTISATHLLTPTIQHISHSPSGRIATPLLSYLPFLPLLLQLGSKSLTGTLPRSWISTLVRRVTGMKSEEMVNVTVDFLGRTGAVKQALELAGWEMKEIGEGSWRGAVWEGSEVGVDAGEAGDGDGSTKTLLENRDVISQWNPPTHHFLFADEDHWVADETRETIIKTMNGRAKILIDEGEMGLVHAWCLEQSEMVAGIASGWIEDMLFGNQ